MEGFKASACGEQERCCMADQFIRMNTSKQRFDRLIGVFIPRRLFGRALEKQRKSKRSNAPHHTCTAALGLCLVLLWRYYGLHGGEPSTPSYRRRERGGLIMDRDQENGYYLGGRGRRWSLKGERGSGMEVRASSWRGRVSMSVATSLAWDLP